MTDIKLGPWPKGMNNRQESHALPEGTLRNLVNGDFDNLGFAKLRKGCTKVYGGFNARAGYSCPLGQYFVEGITLKQLNPNNSATVVYQGIYGDTITFFYHNSILYFSDGQINLKITPILVSKWGIVPPNPPILSGISGSYAAGTYLAAMCWVDFNGVESGASLVTSITLPDTTGIKFNALPVKNDIQVNTLRLYLSQVNGSILYHLADTNGFEYSIAAGDYSGTPLGTNFVAPPTGGRIIRQYNSRMYIADSVGVVRYSDPFEPDHFRISDAYLLFNFPVTIMEPVKNGIFFATEKETFFYGGNPENGFDIIQLFPYGGVYGTGRYNTASGEATWQSTRGTIVGTPDGQAKNIQEENVAPESAGSGAAIIKEEDGKRQFVVSLKDPSTSKLAAKSFIESEIIRRQS